MTRNTTTKLVATALAVASLGIAGSAQAAEGQGIAIGEPTPGKPVPVQPTGQGNPGTPVDPGTPVEPETPVEPQGANTTPVEPEEVDYNSAAYFNSKEAKDRYERYCNMKDAEPSHSDKKFCEDYRNHHKGGATTRPPVCYPDRENPGTEKWCPKPHPTKPAPTSPSKGTGYEENGRSQPTPQVEQGSKGSLPFTGLEIWQLGLLGLVLVGGGFGARRLLAG